VKTFIQFLNESGIEYERKVRWTMAKSSASFDSIIVKRSKGKGAFSAHDVDVSLQANGQLYDIEIKKNTKAQMGGISVNYTNGKFDIKKSDSFDDETIKLLMTSIKSKNNDLDKVIDFFRKNDPVFKHNANVGFPLRVSTQAWDEAIKLGHIKTLNNSIKQSSNFINMFYKSKGIDYIQIGGSGLFYMNDNPLGLNIPKLKGEINVEFRAGKSGVKYNKQHDYEYSTVVLRLQGRLQFKGLSNYSLDNEKQTKELYHHISKTLNKDLTSISM